MNIIEMLVPDAYVFPDFWGNTPSYLILHRTAGFQTAQDVAAYFQSGSNGLEVSSHYVVGLDGTIVQCVRETDGAGANGVIEAGADPWWTGNPNLVTYSIESVDPTSDNSTVMPEAQKAALFWLIADLCTRRHIPMRPADGSGGITGHFSIDPQSRRDCPGQNFPWAELWAYLKGATHMPIPQGWKDDGTKLVAPNGHYAVKGFRSHILNAPSWDAGDVPLEEEQSVPQVELHTGRGAGTRQLTMFHLLVYTDAMGVKESACGAEIQAAYNKISDQAKQIATLEAQIAALQQPPIVQPKIDLNAAIAALNSMNKDAAALKTALGVS